MKLCRARQSAQCPPNLGDAALWNAPIKVATQHIARSRDGRLGEQTMGFDERTGLFMVAMVACEI
jgi:hypothetical protein